MNLEQLMRKSLRDVVLESIQEGPMPTGYGGLVDDEEVLVVVVKGDHVARTQAFIDQLVGHKPTSNPIPGEVGAPASAPGIDVQTITTTLTCKAPGGCQRPPATVTLRLDSLHKGPMALCVAHYWDWVSQCLTKNGQQFLETDEILAVELGTAAMLIRASCARLATKDVTP